MPISGLFTKKLERFPDYQRDKTKRNFEIYVKIGAFWYQICRGSKNFVFGLTAGKFGLKVLFVSSALILSVAESPADHESTNEQDFRGCNCDDKPEFIDRKSTSKTQVFI